MRGETQTGPDLTADRELTRGPAVQAAEVICAAVSESAAAAFGDQLRGVILVGSMGRGEATVVSEKGTQKVLGDAEFLLVFNEESTLPHPAAIAHARQEAEERIAKQGVSVELDLAAVHARHLRQMPPGIYTYEVKVQGKVVWGDPDILSLIPGFHASDIPYEDAWRLLCNRMIELLEAAGETTVTAGALPPVLHYRTVKLYQDMATSFLVFSGCYEPAYRSRAERLSRMAADPQPPADLPFRLADFSARVSACTRFKLSGLLSGASNATGCPASAEFLRTAINDAHALWRWELERLIGDQSPRPDTDLMSRWMRTVSFRARIRGWARVLRKSHWHRSFRLWPRWLRLAMKSSARYCVYAAGSQLFFRLAKLSDPSQAAAPPDRDLRQIRLWLPVEHRALKQTASGWNQAMLDVCWNYNEFLKDTQS